MSHQRNKTKIEKIFWSYRRRMENEIFQPLKIETYIKNNFQNTFVK